MQAARFIGIDLTDPYARAPRPADVALLDRAGRCQFTTLPAYRSGRQRASTWLEPLGARPRSGDLLIIDGPLGLASRGQRSRESERMVRAPGKTPDHLPLAGTFPYSGFVRGSVELATALVRAGWAPARDASALQEATLLEAFPGAAWSVLAGIRLPDKSSPAGRAARAQLLVENGLQLPAAPTSHDQLDAALCAWMGWTLHRAPERIDAAGEPCARASHTLREGYILRLLPHL